MKMRQILKCVLLASIALGSLLCGLALADDVVSGIAISQLATNVNTTVKHLSTVLSDISLVSGVGFTMASFFKLHQHKQNPTQVPMSQGISLLLIGVALALFPTLLTTSKRAVFGGSAQVAQIGGSQIHKIIGSKT